jgi:alpha-D-ribose 1-methylphosphonate 5-triphosphate synthase subunit PhnH
MSAVLAGITPGFHDAVHGAQRSFRGLLDAMSRPGRVVSLPAAATEGIVPPGDAIGLGATALLLTLLDADTTLQLAGGLAGDAAAAYLRFHTGVRLTAEGGADFTLARAADVDERLCSGLALGSDEAPQRGATLIVEVDALADAPHDGAEGVRLCLRGPGIESLQRCGVSGLGRPFWEWRLGLQSLMPRGIDLVMTCGTRLAALPRSTRITLDR